ncbi:MAG TPA: DEAD/DEAH box helicase [bacterium]|nr:DEAD/DEAH box helicase [bacterium]
MLSFLNQPLESAVGLSKTQLNKITKNIGGSIFNLIVENIPEKYETRLLALNIHDLIPGEMSTFKGRIIKCRKGFGKIPAVISVDFDSHVINLTFFGKVGDIYTASFNPDDEVLISGEVNPKFVFPGFVNPELFRYDSEWKELLSGIVPVYKKIQGVSHLFMLRTVRAVLLKLKDYKGDWMLSSVIESEKLPPLIEALMNIHFPKADIQITSLVEKNSSWHRRIAFDKLFFLQFGAYNERILSRKNKNRKIEPESELSINVESRLPFKLTASQSRVLEEIRRDISSEYPMNRLLQGDVGSGKTAVMILVGLDMVNAGFKTVIMAPTEILATQHYDSIKKMVPENISCQIITGGVIGKKRKKERSEDSYKADFIIGTHALYENLEFMSDIGLIIIDEQHRFGVAQRMKLMNRSYLPDVLIVSATPIPRSLALTIYGVTDISVINEMPPGRIPIRTRYVRNENRSKVLEYVVDIINTNNEKGYWVCPLVEESEKMDLKHVQGVYEEFSSILGEKAVFLHGKIKGDEKNEIIQKLKSGKVNIIISTVVIEVGVDVSDATFMVIENADRFGLAQLHQLRGRVGRSDRKSFCALIASSELSEKADRRLEFISKNENGFRIAEYDLKTRGPGSLAGLDQSGYKNDSYFLLAAQYGEFVEKTGEYIRKMYDSDSTGVDVLSVEKVFNLFFKDSFNRFKTG